MRTNIIQCNGVKQNGPNIHFGCQSCREIAKIDPKNMASDAISIRVNAKVKRYIEAHKTEETIESLHEKIAGKLYFRIKRAIAKSVKSI